MVVASDPRGTDPRSSWNVIINECDDSPDFVEFRNLGGSSIDLRSWFLHTSSNNLSNHARIYPWPDSYTVNSGAYFVIGETSTPPTEMPGGTPYVDIAQNIPWIGEEYDCALYDCYGRLVDIVRTTGDNDSVVHNNARAPSHWSDFTGSAAREPQAGTGGSGAIARRTSIDNDNGGDWVSAFNRTMGSSNPSVNSSLAGNDCLMDVVLNGTPGGGGITTIINAGPAFAGYKWSFTYSVNHNQGTGPFYGLGADALPNYLYLSQTPPFFGFLDANGSARLDFNSGTIPVGIDTDDIFILQDPAGNIVAVTDILEFDS